MNLRYKISLSLIFTTLVPVSIIIFFVIWYITLEGEENSKKTIQNYVQLTSTKLSDELQASIREVEIYSQVFAVKSMRPNLYIPFFKSELERQNGRYEKLFISDLNGHFYTNFCGNPHQDMKCTFDDKDPNAKPKHLKAREYWQKLVGNNQAGEKISYLSDPVISYTTGVKQMLVTTSVHDYSNQLRGLLGASIEWARIESLLTEITSSIFSQYEWKPRIMLISDNGTYWYHWQAEKLVHLKTDPNGEFIKDDAGLPISVSSNIYDEKEPELHLAHKKMLEGESGVLEFVSQETYDNNYLFYAPIEDSQYSLALVVSDKDLNVSSYNIRSLYIGVFFLALCAFVLTAIMIAKAITEPIGKLVGQANKLKEGDYNCIEKNANDAKNSDELNELSETFSQMAKVILDRQKRLEESEERFNLAMKGANDGLWDWDINANKVYYSPRWKNMLGYCEEELEENVETYFKLLKREDHKMIREEIEKLQKAKDKSFSYKISMKHRDGHYIHILTRGFIVRDETGQATRFVGTHVDISEQTLNEEKIKKLNEGLEKTVKERTLKLELANRHLKEIAMMDMMLNIGNRRALDKHLIKAHDNFTTQGETYGVLVFDVDFFKRYNDLYGHQEGDNTLIETVECLKTGINKQGSLYRFGGEEFICVLPNITMDKAFDIAARMVEKVSELNIPHQESDYKHLTISVGCAIVNSMDESFEDVIKRSDSALYVAKQQGRNQASRYDTESA